MKTIEERAMEYSLKDFEGNDGDVFEVEIEDVAEVIEPKQGEC